MCHRSLAVVRAIILAVATLDSPECARRPACVRENARFDKSRYLQLLLEACKTTLRHALPGARCPNDRRSASVDALQPTPHELNKLEAVKQLPGTTAQHKHGRRDQETTSQNTTLMMLAC
jgi:hypothetical protein